MKDDTFRPLNPNSQTFTLRKQSGMTIKVTGVEVTHVMCQNGYLSSDYFCEDWSVIRLASGELVLYVSRRQIPHSNNYQTVERLYRNAQDMTPDSVLAATGEMGGCLVNPVMKALGINTVEEIA